MKTKRLLIFLLILLMAGGGVSLCLAQPQPAQADYGDAPDGDAAGYPGIFAGVIGNFPTRFGTINSRTGSPGAFTLDGSMESLGAAPSLEADAQVVDQDDDDNTSQLVLFLASIPAQAVLSVDVTVATAAPRVPRYLNVLIDLNLDGRWGDVLSGAQSEWVVRNMRIDAPAGQTTSFSTPTFAFGVNNRVPDRAWARIALTRSQIDVNSQGPLGWDGSGAFAFGEIEDYQISLPRMAGGKVMPQEGICCPKVVNFRGANSVDFFCIAYSWNLVVGGGGPQLGDVFFQYLAGPVLAAPGLTPVVGFGPPPAAGGVGAPTPALIGRTIAPFPPPPTCLPPAVGGPFGNAITIRARRPNVAGPFASRYSYFIRPVDPPELPQPGKIVPLIDPVISDVTFTDIVGVPLDPPPKKYPKKGKKRY